MSINNSSIDKDFYQHIDLHTLITLVDYLIHFIKQNDTEEITQTLDLLKKATEDLKN